LSVQGAAAAARYLVLFKKEAVPSDLSRRVQTLGGAVRYSHPVGIAIVDGLDAAGAAQLAAGADVAQVQQDVDVALDPPQRSATVQLGAPIAQSQGNPASAILFSWQWNMRDIKADQAWAAGKLGSSSVTVAILDTGIDYDSFDLNGLVDLSRSTSFVATDDSITAHFFPGRNRITDYNGHGTNVASQVSSKAVALAGVTSKTTLIGVKVLGANGSGSSGGVLQGILWAADHGADVANMSLGSTFARAGNGRLIGLINRVFSYAVRHGTLVVVAAGNAGTNLDTDPNFDAYCSVWQAVCVSAVGPTTPTGNPDAFAFYSNFGRKAVDVAAPGGNSDGTVSVWPWGADDVSWVWSLCSKTLLAGFTSTGTPVLAGCQPGNFLIGFIGTSQATPHAAGVAALIAARVGHGKPLLVRVLLQATADRQTPFLFDPQFGTGRVDAARAAGL
jgi:subtilisin family serine protease